MCIRDSRLTQEFIETLRELVDIESDAVIWTAQLKSQIFELRQRGVDMSEAFKIVEDAIAAAEDAIEKAVEDLKRMPAVFFDMFISMDNLRRAVFSIKEEIRSLNSQFHDLIAGPQAFLDAQRDLIAAQAELKAAEESGSEARIKAAREWVSAAQQALADAEKLKDGLAFLGLVGDQALAAINDAILAARGGGEGQIGDEEIIIGAGGDKGVGQRGTGRFQRLRRQRITGKEERDILRGVENEQTRLLVQQLIAQHNALIEAKLRLQIQKETRQDTRKSRKELKDNLPGMKDKLQELRDFSANFDGYWNTAIDIWRDIRDKMGPETESGFGAAGGIDFISKGPSSGYRSPLQTLHGTERVTVTPMGSRVGSSPVVNIVINADNPEGFRHWLNNLGGNRELAKIVAKAKSFDGA